jgi:flagella basal body P-ring formation protein FlgA
MTGHRHTLWLAITAGLLVVTTSEAAEIRLRSEVQCDRAVVRLGDLAEIHAADPQRAEVLRSLELFPAPAEGLPRIVHGREIQEILFVRGMNVAECRISGASLVKISVASHREEQLKAIIPAIERRALQAVRTAVLAYLEQQRQAGGTIEVKFKLTTAQVRSIDAAVYQVKIGGGQAPWVGGQRFELLVDGAAPMPLDVEVEVHQASVALVATRSIARGTIVQPTDVRLESLKPGTDNEGLCDRVEMAVGKEATRTIAVGQWVEAEFVRQPLMIHRNDAVTVFSRSAGLRVRTTARACEDGSLGDVIPIESMLNRQKFLARVSGSQEVEIYARPADTTLGQSPVQSSVRTATR